MNDRGLHRTSQEGSASLTGGRDGRKFHAERME